MEEEETYDSPEPSSALLNISQEVFSQAPRFLTPLQEQQLIRLLHNCEDGSELLSIPHEVFSQVVYYLTPLQRQQLISLLPCPEQKFFPVEMFSSWIWSKIFKRSSWPDQISAHIPTVDLAIISPDLENLSRHPNSDACLLLLKLDWSVKLPYLEGSWVASLQNPELYDAQRKEVRLAGTCIKVQFSLGPTEDNNLTIVRDPSVFFRQSNGKLWTKILYYSDDTIYTISEDCIRGVNGISRKKKTHIRERCLFNVTHRDNVVRPQGLFALERPTPVVKIRGPRSGGVRRLLGWRARLRTLPAETYSYLPRTHVLEAVPCVTRVR